MQCMSGSLQSDTGIGNTECIKCILQLVIYWGKILQLKCIITQQYVNIATDFTTKMNTNWAIYRSEAEHF